MLTNLLYVVLAVLVLGVIIVFHELGHFIVGRMCGIGVIEFAVGFGPKLFGWTRKGIDYSIRAFPLGGFCKFVGEDDDNSAPNAMNNMPVWKRFLTVFAGPAMNFVLAFVGAVIMLCLFYGTIVPRIDTLIENMPAQEAQLLPGDVILSANGTEISYDTEGTNLLRGIVQTSDSIDLTVRRGEETLSLTLVPDLVTDETGAEIRQIGVTFAFKPYSLATAIPGAAGLMKDVTVLTLDFLRDLVFKGEGVEEVAGPIGTVAVVSEYIALDPSQLLYFVVIISMNLGIMNLLPLPALDGGRLVFLTVEAIRRKPIPPEKEGMVHGLGLIAFFALAIVLAWHDIATYIIK